MTRIEKLNKIKELIVELQLLHATLHITDRRTGAGYITNTNDAVFARWGSYTDAIALLEQYTLVGAYQ